MKTVKMIIQKFTEVVNHLRDFPLLGLRLLLAFGFYYPAMQKWNNMEATIMWFGNEEWGLGLPFPELQAYLAASTEFLGVWMLLFGIGTRIISIPLFFTMIMAYFTVHIDHGWYVIGQSALNVDIAERIAMAKDLLKENGDYSWLTAKGSFVILQNGAETIVTYMLMLATLISVGPGKWSADYLIEKKFMSK